MHDFLTGRPVVIPGDGTQVLNAVYLDDVVDGHLRAMAAGRPGARYILGGENASVRQLAALVNEVSGARRRLWHVPFWLAKLAGLLDEPRARLTGGTPLLTWESVEIYRHSWAYRSDKAMRELGYRPRSLRDGIALTFAWFGET
jgi:farnesol dehydrogenase